MARAILLLCLLMASPSGATGWVAAWATAPTAMETEHRIAALDEGQLLLRQTVLLSLDGSAVRVRISNRHGDSPLRIAAAHVGLAPFAGANATTHPRQLRFGGQTNAFVAAGAELASDPLNMPVSALRHLAIDLLVEQAPRTQTGHPGARTHSHWSRDNGARTGRSTGWHFLAAVDVARSEGAAVAILGDSIADGYGVPPDSDTRWPDHLARRLQADPATRQLAVVNLGIGGNRLTADGLGPNALSRLPHDILLQSGVRHMLLHIGVNDIGIPTRGAPRSAEDHAVLRQQLLAGFAAAVAQARERGIRVIGGTILPFASSDYYRPGPEDEATRQTVNGWLRAPGNVDALVDFDQLMRDPRAPERLAPAFDSGDGLHPSAEGYRFMADAAARALSVAKAGPPATGRPGSSGAARPTMRPPRGMVPAAGIEPATP